MTYSDKDKNSIDSLSHEVQRASFDSILKNCLQAKQTDEFLVIHDESFDPYLKSLVEVVGELRIPTTFLKIPLDYQRILSELKIEEDKRGVVLSDVIGAAVSEADVILNVLDGNPDTANVRKAIIHLPRRGGCRFAHVPGISPHNLRIVAETPMDEVLNSCDLVGWALGEADKIDLETVDQKGQRYNLAFELQGWDNEPLISPGVIFPDSWGNIPPAEVFCCPKVATVNGQICINGSVPNVGIGRGQEIILTFKQGKLMDWSGQGGSNKAVEFFAVEEKKAQSRGDLNWNTFCEFGIGLNPVISELTGDSLFDEKAAKTAHIAIGGNDAWGHPVESDVHHDLVTVAPTILVDGRVLMQEGELQLSNIRDWQTADNSVLESYSDKDVLMLRENRAQVVDGELVRRLTKARRGGYIRMTDSVTARLLSRLHSTMAAVGDSPVNEFLGEHPEFDNVPTKDLLKILRHYRIVTIYQPR